MSSSSNSPCAACKCLRRKCTQECVFAPYFPPDNPQKFITVHKVFGASNVSKILNELDVSQRETAVTSLVYEAEFRLREPIYGCVGLISIYQHKLRQVQHDLENSKKELATYIGPSAMLPAFNNPALMQIMAQHNMQQPQQFHESQQHAAAAAAAAREQEMMRSYGQQHQQQHNELMRFHGGIDESGAGPSVTATGFTQMAGGGAAMQQQPSLGLGNSYEATIPYHEPHTQPQDLLLQQHQQQLMGFHGGFDESGAGPSMSITTTGFSQMAGGATMQQQPASLGLNEAIPYHQIQVSQEEPHAQSHMINLQQQRSKSEEARSVGPPR